MSLRRTLSGSAGEVGNRCRCNRSALSTVIVGENMCMRFTAAKSDLLAPIEGLGRERSNLPHYPTGPVAYRPFPLPAPAHIRMVLSVKFMSPRTTFWVEFWRLLYRRDVVEPVGVRSGGSGCGMSVCMYCFAKER